MNAFKLPGDVYQGKADPLSEQSIGRAAELAGAVVLGPAPIARKAIDGTLGSIGGVTARTANLSAKSEAEALHIAGKDPETIWQQTGWYQGSDGKWRHEIPGSENARLIGGPVNYDEAAEVFRAHGMALDQWSSGLSGFRYELRKWKEKEKIDPETLPDTLKQVWEGLVRTQTESDRYLSHTKTNILKNGASLPEVLHYPELFEAYPQLKEYKIRVENTDGEYGGYYDHHNKEIVVNQRGFEGRTTADQRKYLIDLLLHETQHGIQRFEEFPGGTNTGAAFQDLIQYLQKVLDRSPEGKYDEMMEPIFQKIEKAPAELGHALYLRDPGEIEARIAAMRREYGANFKKQYSPINHQRNIAIADPAYKELRMPEK